VKNLEKKQKTREKLGKKIFLREKLREKTKNT
jgi:hypothetical protein